MSIAESPAAASSVEADAVEQKPEQSFEKGFRFWAIFGAILVTTLLVAVESTVTSTALPHIVRELDGRELYVWFVDAYFLTSTAFLPFFGQLCDIFGRRWIMILTVAIFTLGSGISGGATSSAMLIAGRAVQGIGGGGINLCIELIISDLIPLRERSAYIGIVFAFFTLGTGIGPFVGGVIVDHISWRWVFYINLPIGGAALLAHFVFLRVKYDRETSIWLRLKRIDYIGNAILIASVVAVLLALSRGGTLYPWASYQILVPLLLGILGLVVFHVYEGLPWVRDSPTLPERIFKSRTTAAALGIAFIHFLLLFWVIYFLPIYFQAVLEQSPTLSGVDLLPTVILSVLTGGVAGGVMAKTGRYRPLHIVAFLLIILGMGLFAHFGPGSHTAEWIIVQIIPAFGFGFLASTTLPAVQADLPESDAAAATAAFAFMRAYGSIWGVSIPAAIFNAQFASQSWRIGDQGARDQLAGGNAYSYASAAYIRSFDEPYRSQIKDVYARSLRLTWYVSIAFGVIGLILSVLEKELVLRTELETEFGLEDRKKSDSLGDAERGENMSYAQVAAAGAKQSAKEAAAPQPPQIIPSETASTSSLIDVDTPSVRTVPSDFLEQDIQTSTQEKRRELEEAAANAAARARAEADLAKKKSSRKARRVDNALTKFFGELSEGASTAIVATNLAAVVGVSAYLGYKALGLYERGRLTWANIGIGAGVAVGVGLFEAALGGYLYKGKKKGEQS
ncbi:major facilitator superfamily domain-containing protein [Xylaria cf. heliscus]|nr:major facilitator superfamily domain-containing protein [Xylaria cf. heliscus]